MESLKIKQELIKKEYKNIEKTEENLNIITDKILDVFGEAYAKSLRNSETDLSHIEDFIMPFVVGKYRKQIKMNILVHMALINRTYLTLKIRDILINRYFKKNIPL